MKQRMDSTLAPTGVIREIKAYRAAVAFYLGLAFLLVASLSSCTSNSSTTDVPSQSTAPPSPVAGIRNKISAGDLLSAESILEVHREKNGEDGPWLVGLSWLARGAILLGDTTKAEYYAARVRSACAERMKGGADLEKDGDLEIAYGAAIEVETQRLAKTRGDKEAILYLQGELA